MRRVARHLFTLCSAVSLLLCIAVCVLWVRSGHVAERVECRQAARHVLLESSRGTLGLSWRPAGTPSAKSPAWRGIKFNREPQPSMRTLDVFVRFSYQSHPKIYSTRAEHGGFAIYAWLPSGYTRRHRLALAPHWSVAAITALTPLAWAVPRVRALARGRRAAGAGCCPACNYDLRASPERCPECGAVTKGHPA